MKTGTDNHEKALDGVKGLAIGAVAFCWHYQHFQPQSGMPFYPLLANSYDHGWLMVELFFMLSGYGMMAGYSERIRNHEISFRDYMLKRIRRLYPISMITLVVTAILEGLIVWKTGNTFVYPNYDIYHFILHVLCLQDGILGMEFSFNGPAWCISIFMLLYIVLYLILYHIRDLKKICWILIGIVLAGGIVLIKEWEYPIANTFMARGFTCFAVGGLIYVFFRQMLNMSRKSMTWLGWAALLIVVIQYVILRIWGENCFGNLQMFFILCAGPMILLAALYLPWLSRLLSIPPFRYMGRISIGIYLFHFPVQCLMWLIKEYKQENLDFSWKVLWVTYIGLVVAIAIIYERGAALIAKKKQSRRIAE